MSQEHVWPFTAVEQAAVPQFITGKNGKYKVTFHYDVVFGQLARLHKRWLFFWFEVDRSYYDRDPETGSVRLIRSYARRGNYRDMASDLVESYERNEFGQQL